MAGRRDEDEDGEEEDADQLSDMRAMMAQYTHARGGAPDGGADRHLGAGRRRDHPRDRPCLWH